MRSRPWDQRLAGLAARGLRRARLSPNAITAAGLALGLAGAFLLSRPDHARQCIGGAGFALAAFADHLDGELARLTDRTSRFGHYFDRISAATVYTATFVGIGWGQREGALGPWSVALGALAGVSIALIFTVRNDLERRRGHASIEQPARLGFEIEDTLYLLAPLACLGWLSPTIAAAGIGAPAYLALTLARSRRGRA